MVGMRKSLRIRGSSDVRECLGAFWFPAFLLCVLLGKLQSALSFRRKFGADIKNIGFEVLVM